MHARRSWSCPDDDYHCYNFDYEKDVSTNKNTFDLA